MGYGFGGFLLVVGLVLALAVTDRVNGVDLTMVGWIMALVGAALIVLNAVTMGRRSARSVSTTTHSDGSQTVSERRTEV
jgi:membrane protein implicated in regulation of membrane protease activity